MTAARILLLALVFALVPSVTAQAPDRAELALGPVQTSQPFGDAWAVAPGGAGRLALPLHGGTAELSLRVLHFDGLAPPERGPLPPDFLLLSATFGWGPTLQVGPAELTPLARVGAVQFRFAPTGDQVQAQFLDETEATVGAALRVAVPLGRVAVWAEGEALRVLLRDPETLASLSGGVAVRFNLPPAIRRLLDE